MTNDHADREAAPPGDPSTLPGLGSVRDLLTGPGLVGFQMEEQRPLHSSSAKVGKPSDDPPPPPPPPPP
ncbi:hypothetical protein STAQ_18990 [Allostella sp. ATCC 35155]|nr:hypothetical protein STAQ_18990 [Stella sp. ATCC 35155]